MRGTLDPLAMALAAQPSTRSSGASGTMSVGNQIGYKVRNIAMSHMPKTEIELETSHGAHGAFVTSFSTMDTIKGTVVIAPERDTRFDQLDITFVGISKTWVDRLASSPAMGGGRSTATHRFLRLIQPINEEELPQPRVFQAGMTYRFPFTFVVPQQLLPRSCTHKVDNDAVRDAHMLLPPSMGDPEVAGFGGMLLDDMAPDMAKVLYVIKVRAVANRQTDDEETVVIDRVRKLRIKPAYDEQPPLSVDPFDSNEYRLRQEKTFRRNMFKSKAGSLIMEAQQPKSLCIPGARTDVSSGIPNIGTVAKVILRFDPLDETTQPPKLSSLTSKLKVGTYHASSPRNAFPSKKGLAYDMSQGYYTTTVPLSSRCIMNTAWVKHDASSNPAVTRRDSGASLSELSFNGIPGPSSTYANKSFYIATITVPITLPTNKNFLPSFHSCLISRVYTLGLSLNTQSSAGSSTTLNLKVPVQVSCETSADALATIREQQVEQENEQQQIVDEVNQMFGPSRRMSEPVTRAASPPRYSYLAPRGSIGARRVSMAA